MKFAILIALVLLCKAQISQQFANIGQQFLQQGAQQLTNQVLQNAPQTFGQQISQIPQAIGQQLTNQVLQNAPQTFGQQISQIPQAFGQQLSSSVSQIPQAIGQQLTNQYIPQQNLRSSQISSPIQTQQPNYLNNYDNDQIICEQGHYWNGVTCAQYGACQSGYYYLDGECVPNGNTFRAQDLSSISQNNRIQGNWNNNLNSVNSQRSNPQIIGNINGDQRSYYQNLARNIQTQLQNGGSNSYNNGPIIYRA